eukprot:scpid34730/ scgid4345/ GTPase-activating protein and VPS9 domain-containing protein 1
MPSDIAALNCASSVATAPLSKRTVTGTHACALPAPVWSLFNLLLAMINRCQPHRYPLTANLYSSTWLGNDPRAPKTSQRTLLPLRQKKGSGRKSPFRRSGSTQTSSSMKASTSTSSVNADSGSPCTPKTSRLSMESIGSGSPLKSRRSRGVHVSDTCDIEKRDRPPAPLPEGRVDHGSAMPPSPSPRLTRQASVDGAPNAGRSEAPPVSNGTLQNSVESAGGGSNSTAADGGAGYSATASPVSDRSSVAASSSAAGIRRLSSALSLKVRRKRGTRGEERSTLAEVAVSPLPEAESAKSSMERAAAPLDARPAMADSPPPPSPLSHPSPLVDSSISGGVGESGSKASFWKASRLSNFVASRRKPNSFNSPPQSISPVEDASPSASRPRHITPSPGGEVADGQADSSVLDDITAKYQRLAEAEKTKREEEQNTVTDGVQAEDSTEAVRMKQAENEAIFYQAKRQLELLLSEPPVSGVAQYASTVEEQYSELRLPVHAPSRVVVKTLLQEELDSAHYWSEDEKAIETRDTLNLIGKLGQEQLDQMLHELAKECRQRSFYAAYLLQVKHGLVAAASYLENMSKHIQRTQSTVQLLFASSCARSFVEKHSSTIDAFVEDFNSLQMVDEKSVAVEDFLSELCSQLDDETVWRGMSDDEWHSGQLAVERYCFGRIYRSAFWPNGETDKLRDRLIREHIESLTKSITVFHKSLQIAPKYCGQAPWPAAVTILKQLCRYKAPVDKLNVVSDCAQCIMLLLSRASRYSTLSKHHDDGVDEAEIEHSVPGADDLFPVLVYVIIQANPLALLSTVAYIENYHRSRMQGEASYWWAQFQSAVEYIKTLKIDA